MPRIFINYRTGDGHSYGALLYNDLSRHFGSGLVFLDCESIPAGADFPDELLSRVRACQVLIAVIGPRWLTVVDGKGQRLIDDPEDWVRRELAEAFAAGVTVMPVLTDAACPPAISDLPPEIAWLSRCQARRLRHQDVTADLARIRAEIAAADPFLAEAAGMRSSTSPWAAPLNPGTDPGTTLSTVPWPTGPMVARPELTDRLVEVLCAEDNGLIGLTAALVGAGGFGKTTIAREVGWHPEVRAHFTSGVLWGTLGERATEAELVGKINDLARLLSELPQTFTDLELAGQHLGRLLGEQRRLLIIDDVWQSEQLAPFLVGGPGCTRLITTRTRSVLPYGTATALVDAMTADEARQLLSAGLPRQPPNIGELRRHTGSWPVLLTLANGALAEYVRRGLTVAEAGRRVMDALEADGPAGLDVTDTRARQRAVSLTVEASLALLAGGDRDWLTRYVELAVFPEDTVIPILTLQRYWAATGGLAEREAERLCLRLADLHLVQDYRLDPPRLQLHDVIRSYLRHRIGDGHPGLHRTLVDAHRPLVPSTGGRTCWWQLPDDEPYLWEHLAGHLHASGTDRQAELSDLTCDLRWVVARMNRAGPGAAAVDLSLVDGPVSGQLRRLVEQNAHLLAPLEPTYALGATLMSRLANVPELEPLTGAYQALFAYPRLAPAWPMPDLPHPAFRLAVPAESHPLSQPMAVAPDGTWLATGSYPANVKIWDCADGRLRTVLDNGLPIWALGIAPDGSWLAAATYEGLIRIWNLDNGSPQKELTGHTDAVFAVSVAPDGSWLASASRDKTVRLWNAVTGDVQAVLPHPDAVTGLEIAPDGAWLVTTSYDSVVRIWTITGRGWEVGAELHGHDEASSAVVIAPDSSWLASGGWDGTVRLWDPADWSQRAVLSGHLGWVNALAAAPDSSWLASAATDHTVRTWDATTGRQRAILRGHSHTIGSVAIGPDGSWLASAGVDMVRTWTTPDEARHADVPTAAAGIHGVVAVAPDGTWFATGDSDHNIRIWDAITGAVRTTLSEHDDGVHALAVAPDGTWLASVGDRSAHLWDVATGRLRMTIDGLTRHPNGVTIAPDGTWIATFCMDTGGRLWNTADGRQRAVLAGHTTWGVDVSAAAPNGAWVATGGRDNTIRLWETADGHQRAVLDGHTDAVNALAVSPDGSWLASASLRGQDTTVRIWNTDDGRLHTVLHHDHPVGALTVAPDGSWLASGSWGGTILVWDPCTGTRLASLDVDDSSTSTLAPVSSGKLLASGSFGGVLRLWHVGTGQCLTALRVDSDIRFLTWLPPGERLLASGGAGLYVLDLHKPIVHR